MGFIEGDVLLHSLPIYHVHGLFVALHCALLNGSKMIWMRKYDPELVSQKFGSLGIYGSSHSLHKITQGRIVWKSKLFPDEAFCFRLCPLLKETFEQFRQRTGHTILERYGMTEAGMITSNPYNGNRIAGTVGFPLEGISARVSDETGKELRDGKSAPWKSKVPMFLRVTGNFRRKPRRNFVKMDFSSPVIWHAVTSRATFPSSAGAKT